jgi:hypothetical protein
MAPKQLTAVAIYATSTQAEVGVDMLIMKGFKSAGISVLLPERPNNQPVQPQDGTPAAPAPQTTKAGSATAVGATAGGALIGALALLAGAGALAIPGVGPLIAAGPILAGLAGLGVGGAVGGLGGALVGLGLHSDEAHRYMSQVGAGRTLLIVNCTTAKEVDVARAILEASGAQEVSSNSELAARAG